MFAGRATKGPPPSVIRTAGQETLRRAVALWIALLAAGAGGSAVLALRHRAPATEAMPPPGCHVSLWPAELELTPVLASEVGVSRPPVSVRFDLRNHSDEPRPVVFRGASCGCAGVRIGDRPTRSGDELTLQPRERLPVELRLCLHNRVRVNAFSLGFDEEDRIRARCRVEVIQDSVFEPTVLLQEFTRLTPGPVDHEITLTRTSRNRGLLEVVPQARQLPGPIQLLQAEALGPPTEKEGLWQLSYRLRLAVHRPADAASGALTFDPEAGSLPFVVRTVVGIDSPKQLHFGIASTCQEKSKRLVLRSLDQRPFKITGWQASSPDFMAGALPTAAASHHWIDCRFRKARAGGSKGQLVLLTDHPDAPKVVVEVLGVVRDVPSAPLTPPVSK